MLQRMLYENETAYIDGLEHAWTGSIALRRFLLEDSLMSPASMGMQKPISRTEPWESIGESRRTMSPPSNLVFQVNASPTHPRVEPNELNNPESGNENPNAHCGDTSRA
jgi:hypothetical protein